MTLDASICILYYDDIDQCVYLMDNGCGMNKEVILKNWMTIGNSSKKKTMFQIRDEYRLEPRE